MASKRKATNPVDENGNASKYKFCEKHDDQVCNHAHHF